MPNAIVKVSDLRKTYGAATALDGVSFEVFEGEIFGVVGPNGAGKTTAIECLEGLRTPDSGFIELFGLDSRQHGYALRQRIGVQLQESMLQPRLRVWEALDLFTSLYRNAVDWESLLERLGLSEKRNTAFASLSGGQKQRLFIALALVNDPELLFLDELTTGLDPQARRSMWDLLHDIRGRGKTIMLSTHSMEEAQSLCDRVAILDHGRIVALDSPRNLIRLHGGDSRISFVVEPGSEVGGINAVPGVRRIESKGGQLTVYGWGDGVAGEVVNALVSNGVRFSDLRTDNGTLEDVFLTLTGREIRD